MGERTLRPVADSRGGGDGATDPLWSDREFFDNVCTVSVSLVSQWALLLHV